MPVERARFILARTLVNQGYDGNTADLAVWSALWLQSRYCDGVTLLVVFLLLTKNLPPSSRLPQKNPKFGISGKCPFHLGKFVFEQWEKSPERDSLALGAPVAPVLMMPLMAELAHRCGKGVRLEHKHYSCYFSLAGFENEEGLGHYFLMDPDEDEPMLISRVKRMDPPQGTRIITELSLPAKRLRADDTLDLTD